MCLERKGGNDCVITWASVSAMGFRRGSHIGSLAGDFQLNAFPRVPPLRNGVSSDLGTSEKANSPKPHY